MLKVSGFKSICLFIAGLIHCFAANFRKQQILADFFNLINIKTTQIAKTFIKPALIDAFSSEILQHFQDFLFLSLPILLKCFQYVIRIRQLALFIFQFILID